jgi:hypothetical protein
MKTLKKIPLALIIVMLIGLVHGLVYLVIIPPWQHYDEPTHFEYAWLIANWNRIPKPGEFDPQMRRDVAQSMIDHEFYQGMDYIPDLNTPGGQVPIGSYSQLGDPPMHYLLASVPVELLKSQSVTTQLYGARLMSITLLLVSIGAIYGMVCELTMPGSPLRWVIPGGVALLPGYVELMSSINNDVAAAAFMSLVLWGIVRLVKRGWHFWTMVWSGAAVGLCLLTKLTVYIAAPLWLFGLILTLLPGRWKALGWVAAGGLGVLLLSPMLGWGDALTWYRTTDQEFETRRVTGEAPLGDSIFALQIEDPNQVAGRVTQLSQLVPLEVFRELRGQPVTIGAWMWADEPVVTYLPILTVFTAERGANQAMQSAEIGIQPAFYAYHAFVPENTTRLQIHLSSADLRPAVQGKVYLDGVVLVQGEYPLDIAPLWENPAAETGSWGGVPVVNAIRNASAEDAGLRVYPWVDQQGSRVIPDKGRLSLLIYSLVDREQAGRYYWVTIKNMHQTFWGKFAWGHVQLEGGAVYQMLTAATLIGLIGCLGVFGYKFPRYQLSALGLLGLGMAGVWAFALVRGAFYIFNINYFIPGARYAYPAIGPTMGVIGYGWWFVTSLIGKWLNLKNGVLVGVLGFAMVMLDFWSIYSIWRYYAG